ncbi:uncharacterized protein C8Q71DRAFT_769317 [Rhodofomes roseus]|uniref:DUF6534 domain-containing protein n=1 Tax=Rhodofomes roseus TaxID=34475 RepID=A0ABQ8KAU7_9APHY|nr:uncharacterized protein C8Q71DRAFT_769317 [Rhodofomes roseus]KAH9834508.1 hypothetical protein C8Q71DRAFT_769317 [Rhodofomes roseus]
MELPQSPPVMSDTPPLVLDRPTPIPQSVFQGTYGGSLICSQFMLVFYGLSVLQTYLYFLKYEKDRIYLKLLVLALLCLSTLHSILVCYTVWRYLITSYTDVALIIDGEWACYAATSVGVLVCFLVQCFFANTIYQLMNGKWRIIVAALMICLILAQLGFGITLSVKFFVIWKLSLLKETVYIAMIPLLCIRMTTDAVTAATLCIVLYDSSTHSGFESSVKLVKMLITYAANRFVATTIIVVAQTIILIVRPSEIWAMVLGWVTVDIYVNSLLATLNAREHLRQIGKGSSMAVEPYVGSERSGLEFRSGAANRLHDTVNQSTSLRATLAEQVRIDFRSLGHSGGQSPELGDLDDKIKASEHAASIRKILT